jgi:tyrosyl-tRNA synthetase
VDNAITAIALSKRLSSLDRCEDISKFETILSPQRSATVTLHENNNCVLNLLTQLPSAPSKSELRRMAIAGGLYISNRRISLNDLTEPITYCDGTTLLVSFGKNSPYIVKLNNNKTFT